MLAAKSLASRTGMSIQQALSGLEFQHASSEIMDDLEAAIGEASGDIWFDWSDRRGRLKIPVAGSSDPPSGPNVDAAKRILSSRGLLDRADFVRVRWSMGDLMAGQERAWDVLEPLALVGRISAGIDPPTNSVVIDTADDMTAEQHEVVDAAIRAAGVSVRVEPSLGPGPDRSLPPVAVQWTLLTVGDDLRSLLVTFPSGPHAVGQELVSVRETADEIWISVELPDIRSMPGSAVPLVAIVGREIVRLRSPIGGRSIGGPEDSPSWRPVSYLTYGKIGALVPRVLGLSPGDAQRLLRSQGLTPRLPSGEGREIVAQDPPAETPAHPGVTVSLTAAQQD
jgi:hypothetical protein